MENKVTYTITKNPYEEFHVRFRLNGIRQETWDYFGCSKTDAEATAQFVINNWNKEGYQPIESI